jgi:hypothetical protein
VVTIRLLHTPNIAIPWAGSASQTSHSSATVMSQHNRIGVVDTRRVSIFREKNGGRNFQPFESRHLRLNKTIIMNGQRPLPRTHELVYFAPEIIHQNP